MISRTRYGRALPLMTLLLKALPLMALRLKALPLVLAAGFGVASAMPAAAQEVASEGNPDAAAMEAAAPEENDAEVKDTDIMKDVDVANLDWSQLNLDTSTLATNPASKTRLAPQSKISSETSWSSKDKPNGSALSVKQALSPFWDARIGADMNVVRDPLTPTSSDLLSEKLANGGSQPQSSGTAWAAITAPGVGSIWDKTAIEARVDPAQDQSKLGTSLSKSLPLGEQYSLTLQNGYNLIQQGVNLLAVPVPGIAGHPVRNFETEQSAKLSIADTGTSFIAGQTLSSADDKWLRKFGAEQKLFGGLSISGSIGETPLGIANKSLTAGFKRSW
jgi:hypothetical protein